MGLLWRQRSRYGAAMGLGGSYGSGGAPMGLLWGQKGRYGVAMGVGAPLWGQGGCYRVAMGLGGPLWGPYGAGGAAMGPGRLLWGRYGAGGAAMGRLWVSPCSHSSTSMLGGMLRARLAMCFSSVVFPFLQLNQPPPKKD